MYLAYLSDSFDFIFDGFFFLSKLFFERFSRLAISTGESEVLVEHISFFLLEKFGVTSSFSRFLFIFCHVVFVVTFRRFSISFPW